MKPASFKAKYYLVLLQAVIELVGISHWPGLDFTVDEGRRMRRPQATGLPHFVLTALESAPRGFRAEPSRAGSRAGCPRKSRAASSGTACRSGWPGCRAASAAGSC